MVVESTGSLRYDLYAGRVTVNDLWTMTPFADQFWRVSAAGVSGEDLAAILRELNAHGTLSSTRGPQEHMRAVSGGTLPAYASTSEPLPGKVYELWTLTFDRQAVIRAFKAQTKRMASPTLMLDGARQRVAREAAGSARRRTTAYGHASSAERGESETREYVAT